MSKRIMVKITTDSSGDAHTTYECEGFGGTSCESVADIMNVLGQVESKQINDDAYNHELPLPLPNQVG